jgi:aryl carrier-like protein
VKYVLLGYGVDSLILLIMRFLKWFERRGVCFWLVNLGVDGVSSF